MELLRSIAGRVGAFVIYCLILVFGRAKSFEEEPWLKGPLGGDYIGDHPYKECAEEEGLDLVRNAQRGGLVPNFRDLDGPEFDSSKVHTEIKRFYENTAQYRMDVWAKTHFPANLALWLLVATISRKVNQLNFPVGALETAQGMTSEIVLLNRPDGSPKYTGWFRKLAGTDRVVYTGFYMLGAVPAGLSQCVKVVFPMPDGNATVILRPENEGEDGLALNSDGKGFGDVGFYRVQNLRGRMRIWRIHSLKERFRLYVDADKVLRCDHTVRFMGLPVLALHYRIERKELG